MELVKPDKKYKDSFIEALDNGFTPYMSVCKHL